MGTTHRDLSGRTTSWFLAKHGKQQSDLLLSLRWRKKICDRVLYVAEISLKHRKHSFGETDLENYLNKTTNVNCWAGVGPITQK